MTLFNLLDALNRHRYALNMLAMALLTWIYMLLYKYDHPIIWAQMTEYVGKR